MHEFHAWIGLAQSTFEDDEVVQSAAISELRQLLAGTAGWPSVRFDLVSLNGQSFLNATGLTNRRREEAQFLEDLLSFISENLPGSWGLIYDRDDDPAFSSGANAFRVRVLARGKVNEAADPFLSPCNPTIED